MSGEPTDAQLLTCKAMEADASTFPHAVANRIDAGYGNHVYIYIYIYIYIYFVHFSKTSNLVACYYSMYNGGRLQGQSSGHLYWYNV